MILTDADISPILGISRNVPNDDQIIIHPFEERCLTPVGYDLRAGDQYQLLHEGVLHQINEGENIVIPPRETVSIRSLEWVAMPKNGSVSGLICSRVMLVSAGAGHISTTVDPDWVGNLLISFTNNSKSSISIGYGERICTIVFLENKTKSKKLSQHPPGRPDALSQNASRIATEYKNDRRRRYVFLSMIWILFVFLYAGFIYWVYEKYGDNPFFIALIAAGVVFSGFGMDAIRGILRKGD